MFDRSTLHTRSRLVGGNVCNVNYCKNTLDGRMHPVRIAGGKIVPYSKSSPATVAPLPTEEKKELRKKIFLNLKL